MLIKIIFEGHFLHKCQIYIHPFDILARFYPILKFVYCTVLAYEVVYCTVLAYEVVYCTVLAYEVVYCTVLAYEVVYCVVTTVIIA